MSLNKQALKKGIYDDFSQEESVIEEDPDSLAERAPDAYSYNVFPFKVVDNKISIDTANLGEVKPGRNKDDVSSDSLSNLGDDSTSSDLDRVASSASLEDDSGGANESKALVDRLKQERRATILSNRVIQHILDNLETKEAGDNIQLLRELIQYLTERVLTLNESVGTIAQHVSTVGTTLSTVISSLQTMSTTQAASGTIANAAAFASLNTSLSTLLSSLNPSSISSDSTEIVKSRDGVNSDLDSPSSEYKSDLENIRYDNSKSVI